MFSWITGPRITDVMEDIQSGAPTLRSFRNQANQIDPAYDVRNSGVQSALLDVWNHKQAHQEALFYSVSSILKNFR